MYDRRELGVTMSMWACDRYRDHAALKGYRLVTRCGVCKVVF